MKKLDIENTVNTIKRSFRLYMNGVTAQSLRDKGTDYKLNWGVSLQHLREMASEHTPSYDLAIELWKSNVRECKLLATMLMPADAMPREVVDIWMEQLPSQEIGEQLVFNLLQHVDFAPMLAYEWMASDKKLYQICAYNLLGRLFMKGMEPNDRGISEFLDQACVALHSDNASVQHAAMNCVIRFADLGEDYDTLAQKAIKKEGFDFL